MPGTDTAVKKEDGEVSAFALNFEQDLAVAKEAIKKAKERGEEEILLSKIKDPKFHNRTFIDPVKLEELKKSLVEVGLLHAIIVRPIGNGEYERIIGERRFVAHEELGKKTIRALIVDVDDLTAITMMIDENHSRDNKNEYDQVIEQLEYISYSMGAIPLEEVKAILYRYNNFLSNGVKDVSEEEKIKFRTIDMHLNRFRKQTIKTFVNKMSMLNMPGEVIHLIQTINLPYNSAAYLQKLKENHYKEMVKLAKVIEEEDPGFRKIKKMVDEILDKDKVKTSPKKKGVTFKERYGSLEKGYEKLSDADRKKADDLLAKVKAIIEKTSSK